VPQSYRKKEELKTKEIFSILDQLAEIGCFYLGFTGGEPFIRKDIMDILWYAKKKGFEIIIYTNGSLIDKRMADGLSLLKPNKVDITIPAMSKGAFERITQMRDSHKRVFGAIDLLHKRKVDLGFKTCVLKENESEIKDIQDFATSLGALHRLDNMLSTRLDGSRGPYRYRGRLKDDSVARGTYHVARNASHVSRNTSQVTRDTCYVVADTRDLFRCGVGLSQAAITPLGELKMCLMIDYPKYKILCNDHRTSHVSRQEKSLEETWEKLKRLVASIKPDKDYKCDRCRLQPYCKWCPGRSWLYQKSFTSCELESRRWAQIRG
jgi:radical SAM protein with 4Fe4S-binding SPASM domain